MQEWLIHFSTNHMFLTYGVIVFLGFAEGPFLSMFSGVLIRFGYLSFIPAYIALMLGDLIGDLVWYYVGRQYGTRFIKRFGKYVSVTEESVEKVSRIFHKYKDRILIISKISNGFGFALVTIITAGIVRIPFARYISINVIGQFVWTGLLLGVGYFLGNLYTQVDTVFGYAFVSMVVAIFIAAFIGYGKYLKTRAQNINI